MTPLPADIELRCVVSPPREHPWILYHPLYKTETYTHTNSPSFCRHWYKSGMPVSSTWGPTSGCLAKIHLGLLSWRHFSEERQLWSDRSGSLVSQTDDPKHPGMMGGILILTWESSLQRAACVLTALTESANEIQQWVTAIGLTALMELKIASETPAGLEHSPRWYLIYLMFPCLPSPLLSLKRYTLIQPSSWALGKETWGQPTRTSQLNW